MRTRRGPVLLNGWLLVACLGQGLYLALLGIFAFFTPDFLPGMTATGASDLVGSLCLAAGVGLVALAWRGWIRFELAVMAVLTAASLGLIDFLALLTGGRTVVTLWDGLLQATFVALWLLGWRQPLGQEKTP